MSKTRPNREHYLSYAKEILSNKRSELYTSKGRNLGEETKADCSRGTSSKSR